MTVMKEDVMIRKEGIYWTLYIGEEQCGCGFLEDMVEEVKEVASRLDNGENLGIILYDYKGSENE